jgi:hypothetical protein
MKWIWRPERFVGVSETGRKANHSLERAFFDGLRYCFSMTTTRRFLIATVCTLGTRPSKVTTGKEEEENKSDAVGIRERDYVAVKRVGGYMDVVF